MSTDKNKNDYISSDVYEIDDGFDGPVGEYADTLLDEEELDTVETAQTEYILDPKKNRLAEWFAGNGYEEVTPMEFYRKIFPKGLLAVTKKTGHEEIGVGMVQMLVLPDGATGTPVKFYDDLQALKEVCTQSLQKGAELKRMEHERDGQGNYKYVTTITNACTYFGRTPTADNIYELCALIIEIDDIIGAEHIDINDITQRVEGLTNLFNGFSQSKYPTPTYIACSGSGLHLYYVLDRPIKLNRRNFKQHYSVIDQYKKKLMKFIWDTSITLDSPQVQGIAQRYRVVGSPTKKGSICRAFKFGSPVTLDYMNSFCRALRCESLYYLPAKKPKTDGGNCKYNPDTGKILKYGNMKQGAFTNTVKRIYEQAKIGHRYFCLYSLAVVARMCSIEYKDLEYAVFQDGLYDFLNSLGVNEDTGENENPFYKEEAERALKNYYVNENFMRRETFEFLTGIQLPPPVKRNGRTKEEHLKYMTEIRLEKQKQGLITTRKPELWWNIIVYRLLCPKADKADCIKFTGISAPTVRKYWQLIEHWHVWSKYEIDLLQKSIAGHKPAEIFEGNIIVPNSKQTIKEYAHECLERHHLFDKFKRKK